MEKVTGLEKNIKLELGPHASLLTLTLLFRVQIFSNILHIKNILIPTYASFQTRNKMIVGLHIIVFNWSKVGKYNS